MPFKYTKYLTIFWLGLFFLITPSLSQAKPTEALHKEVCPDHSVSRDANETEETFESFVQSMSQFGGWFFEIKPSSSDLLELGSGTYYATSEEEITLKISIFARNSEERVVRYLVLVDEIPLFLDEAETITHDDILITSETITTIDITLPKLSKGIHDLIFVAIPNANETPEGLGVDYQIYAPRATLIIDDITETRLPYESFLPAGTRSTGDPVIGLLLTLDESLTIWNYPETVLTVSAQEVVDFNVLASSNVTDDGNAYLSRFALLSFFNYEQISLSEQSDTLYVQVPNDTAYTRIPATLKTPKLPAGRYDLLTLKINHPRVPLCVLRGEAAAFMQGNIDVMRLIVEVQAP